MPEQNTFTGANLSFQNKGIHNLLAKLIQFRQQLTPRSELYTRSGWDNAMQRYIEDELDKIRLLVSSIAYNPDDYSREELNQIATDTTRKNSQDFNALSVMSDDVLMPTTLPTPVVWKLDGSDKDLPQITTDNCPNNVFRALIKQLDEIFVQATRLDSRFQRNLITKQESLVLIAMINEAYTLAQREGGELNRSTIAVGTLPSQEPKTFNFTTTQPVVNAANANVAK